MRAGSLRPRRCLPVVPPYRRTAIPPCRRAGHHAHSEAQVAAPGERPWQAGAAEQPREREKRAPKPLVAENAEYRARERRKAALCVQTLPGLLQSAPILYARRTHRLASAAAQAGIQVLHQRCLARGHFAALQRAHEQNAPARTVGLVAGGEVGGAGGQAKAAVDAGGEGGGPPVAHSVTPSSATLRHFPGSNESRSRATTWPTPSRYAPKWPRARRIGQGARSRVIGISRAAAARRRARRRSTGPSPVQRITPAPGPALTRPSSRSCARRSSVSSTPSPRTPSLRVIGPPRLPRATRPQKAAVFSGASGCQVNSLSAASRRTSAWTAASVPTKRAASTQSASAARVGERSSSAPGWSEAAIRSRAAEQRASRAPCASSVTSARGSARSLRCSSAMMPTPPNPPTWSLVRSY